MAKKKYKVADRYLLFDNWPVVTIEDIDYQRKCIDFWTIITAEDLLSDLPVKDRAKKIGWSYNRYVKMREKCMVCVGSGRKAKWQIKTE